MPVFRMNLSGEYHGILQLPGWIFPIKAAWLRPYRRVPAMLRQKPGHAPAKAMTGRAPEERAAQGCQAMSGDVRRWTN